MDHSLVTTAFNGGARLLDLLGGDAAFNVGSFTFYGAIYEYIRNEIKVLGFTLMARGSYYASLIALALVTIWVFYQGLRILSGKGDSMMALVMNSARVAFIVTAAVSMGVGGSAVYDTVGEKLPAVITGYVTDSGSTVEDQIDESLFGMSIALSAIDALDVASDPTIEDDKNRALYMTVVGSAGPAITAGVMLLFYQASLALFIGLGPFFILCLMFDQTKDLFRKWLMYGIGTMFSMAVLAAMVSICLKAVIAIAASHWLTAAAGSLFGLNLSSGITSTAMQQGGIGLLLTLLIVTIPPMASNFFQGTLGAMSTYGQVSGGMQAASASSQSRYESATGGNRSQTNQVNNSQTDRQTVNAPPPNTTVPNSQLVSGGQQSQSLGSANDVMKTSPNAPNTTATTTPQSSQTRQITDTQQRTGGRGPNDSGGDV